MKRIGTYLVFVPVAILVLLFAVANREAVTLSLDPFNRVDPAFFVRAPLFIVLFVVLALGVMVGSTVSWIRHGRHRRASRLARAEAERQRAEAERLRAQLAGIEPEVNPPALHAPVPF